jgi:AcrR family transcriptional regulator
MKATTRRTHGLQHGPRSVQVVESVRAATLAELARTGFAGLTIDAVAKGANVNRTTIYRRWPTKAALLAAVAEPLLRSYDEDPDTGSLSGDFMVLMGTIRHNAALPEGQALSAAINSGSTELLDLLRAVIERALGPFRRALDRAVERGELDRAADLDVTAHLAFYGTVFWQQAHGSPPTDEECRRMLRVLLPVPAAERPAGTRKSRAAQASAHTPVPAPRMQTPPQPSR